MAGLLAKRAEEPEPEPEAEQAEPEVEAELEAGEAEPEGEAEAEYTEDATNAANDILRKLWRLNSALPYLKPEDWADRVGAVLWWMSKGNREAGCKVWVEWLGEEARARWHVGFEGQRGSVEKIYRAAQLAGWRYPITNNPNRLHEMVERSQAALVRGGADIYQGASRLVRPVRVSVPAATPAGSTEKRETVVARLDGINEPWLRAELTRHINYVKWDKNERPSGSGVPDGLASAMLNGQGEWRFLTVTGIITTPTLRRDGSVLATEGWDAATGLLVLGPLPEMPPVAAKPTKDDALKAVKWFEDLLVEFPFVDGQVGVLR